MQRSSKLDKAYSVKASADKLYYSGNNRAALTLYWHTLRDLTLSKLQEKGIEFKSTREALVKAIEILPKEKGINLIKFYTIGTLSEWDEGFQEDEYAEQLKVLKNLIEGDDSFKNYDTDAAFVNLWGLRNSLWIKSREKYIRSRNLKIGFFFLSLIVLFLPIINWENSIIVAWIISLLGIGTVIVNFFLVKQARRFYTNGEKLRQHLFFKEIYGNDIWDEEDSHIIDFIDKDLVEEYIDRKSIEPNQDNYLEQEEEKDRKLILRMLENSFFTYMLFFRFSRSIWNGLIYIFLSGIFIIAISFWVVYWAAEDSTQSLFVPRILLVIVNAFFAVDYFTYYFSFKDKSSQLKELDLKLEKLWKSPDEKYALSLFNQYNNILWDAYPIKQGFFDDNKINLNTLVKRRFRNYRTNSK